MWKLSWISMSFSFSQSFTKIRMDFDCEFYICSCFDNAECGLRMPHLKTVLFCLKDNKPVLWGNMQ
jgi:hypothetical protein